MRTVLTKLHIPDKVEIGGNIFPAEGSITLDKEQNGKITGCIVRLGLECDLTIQGVPMKFKSNISHTLTADEMDELMLKFSK
jgi:hypothetical protein